MHILIYIYIISYILYIIQRCNAYFQAYLFHKSQLGNQDSIKLFCVSKNLKIQTSQTYFFPLDFPYQEITTVKMKPPHPPQLLIAFFFFNWSFTAEETTLRAMETNTSTFQIYRSNEAAINVHASLAGWVVKIRENVGGIFSE